MERYAAASCFGPTRLAVPRNLLFLGDGAGLANKAYMAEGGSDFISGKSHASGGATSTSPATATAKIESVITGGGSTAKKEIVKRVRRFSVLAAFPGEQHDNERTVPVEYAATRPALAAKKGFYSAVRKRGRHATSTATSTHKKSRSRSRSKSAEKRKSPGTEARIYVTEVGSLNRAREYTAWYAAPSTSTSTAVPEFHPFPADGCRRVRVKYVKHSKK